MKLMLAFSVGGLLGDVFLHLLPEAWARVRTQTDHIMLGLYVLTGLFAFTIIEVAFAERPEEGEGPGGQSGSSVSIPSSARTPTPTNSCDTQNNNQQSDKRCEKDRSMITGYLNMVANGIDNFSHGLAVAASFLVGQKIGFLTTFAILLHEVPHEFGDYAILMRSGFAKWQAAKAQAATAAIGLLGCAFALTADAASVGRQTDWILPFTAGGFLHIALVSLLPDLLQESDARTSLMQVAAVTAGLGVMHAVNCFSH